MNIVVISTASLPTPPEAYGGMERAAHLIARGLSERGHKVGLVAKTGSNNQFGYELIEFDDEHAIAGMIYDIEKRMGGVDAWIDVTHDKLLTVARPDLPIITNYQVMSVMGNPVNPVCISHAQNEVKMSQLKAKIIYQPIDLEELKPYYGQREKYIVYLGQLIPEKRIEWACEVSVNSGVPLKIYGPGWGPAEYHEMLREYERKYPDLISIKSDIGGQEKVDILQKATALIHPVGALQWCEAGGIVVLEALACGTPVIVSDNGALPEYVVNGYNGYVCKSQGEMESALYKIIDEHPLVYHCRKSAEPFAYQKIAAQYDDLCQRVARGERWG